MPSACRLGLLVQDLDRGRIGLERRAGPVERSRQQGEDHRAGKTKRDRAQDQPAPFADDADQRGEVEIGARRIRPLFAMRRRGRRPANSWRVPKPARCPVRVTSLFMNELPH